MNEKDFLEKYLLPSANKLDASFTHLLPNIPGLKKVADFIVQCELEDTCSTNIMTKYESETLGVRLIEVYKNTQNTLTGVFVRLVGTMSLVKTGYPFIILDAGVSNVNTFTAERQDIATRVSIGLIQADQEQREMVFSHLSEQAKTAGFDYKERGFDFLPDFWGPILMAESKGINLGMVRDFRDYAWNSYGDLIAHTKEKIPFNYRPFQEYMIFDTANREHLSLGRKELSVPVEAQAAFFSVLVSGI